MAKAEIIDTFGTYQRHAGQSPWGPRPLPRSPRPSLAGIVVACSAAVGLESPRWPRAGRLASLAGAGAAAPPLHLHPLQEKEEEEGERSDAWGPCGGDCEGARP